MIVILVFTKASSIHVQHGAIVIIKLLENMMVTLNQIVCTILIPYNETSTLYVILCKKESQ